MNALNRFGTTTLDLLTYLPYFKGKGRVALSILQLCRPVLPLTMRLPNGGRMWVGDDDAGHTLLPYLIGWHERQAISIWRHCLVRLAPDEPVVDIGANVGFYAVLAAKQRRGVGAGLVHAFEPNPAAFALLRENTSLNRLTNLISNQQGIADVKGMLTLFVDPYGISFGSLRQVQDHLTETIQVPVTPLDDYLEQYPGRVGLMKIDIEGAELLALRGARRTIAAARPFILFEEFERAYLEFGYSVCEVREFLEAFGYQLHVIEPHGLRSITAADPPCQPPPVAQNILAVPRGRTL